jgi:glutathione peroxidase-family protein
MKTQYVMGLSTGITGALLLTASWLATAQTPVDSSRSEICGDTSSKPFTNAAGQGPQWKFHKYLIDREDRLAGSYGSSLASRSNRLVGAKERLF